MRKDSVAAAPVDRTYSRAPGGYKCLGRVIYSAYISRERDNGLARCDGIVIAVLHNIKRE